MVDLRRLGFGLLCLLCVLLLLVACVLAFSWVDIFRDLFLWFYGLGEFLRFCIWLGMPDFGV